MPLSSSSAPPFTSNPEIAEASQGASKGRRNVVIYKARKAVDPLSQKKNWKYYINIEKC